MLLIGVLATLPLVPAQAFDLEQTLRDLQPSGQSDTRPILRVAQQGGMTLSQAIESVRRQTDGRIVSAETKVSGGREVHHIKVLTKDGKVRTHRIPGRRLGNR